MLIVYLLSDTRAFHFFRMLDHVQYLSSNDNVHYIVGAWHAKNACRRRQAALRQHCRVRESKVTNAENPKSRAAPRRRSVADANGSSKLRQCETHKDINGSASHRTCERTVVDAIYDVPKTKQALLQERRRSFFPIDPGLAGFGTEERENGENLRRSGCDIRHRPASR